MQDYLRTILFQFQLGTIGTNEQGLKNSLAILFQFQLGTIGTYEAFFVPNRIIISIPVRYDWNFNLLYTSLLTRYFNSS